MRKFVHIGHNKIDMAAAAHQSSITFDFIIAKATEIKTLLESTDEANHKQAARDADTLWDLMNQHLDKDANDMIWYHCLFLTDVRNTIDREHDAKHALYLIKCFIRYVSREAATFSS